jgi:Zn-dependent peptidase ImmA (M78 family)
MSEIDAEGIPVAGKSMKDIEQITMKYLQQYHPETLADLVPLDMDQFLEVSLFKSHGFKLDIIMAFPNSLIEARMRPVEKKIQITQTCFNKIGANEGYARFTGGHEGTHVILHAHQYQDILLNPARMIKRECQTYENAEWQAEHGGGALLMPLKTLIPFLECIARKNYDSETMVNMVMDAYKVSRKGVYARLRQLPKPGLLQPISWYTENPDILIRYLKEKG